MLNKVILIGNIGKDPESITANNGTNICKFSLATSEKQKDSSGQWVDHTEWHRVTVFGKQAESASQYLSKGSKVSIEGKIRTNKWQDKNGQDRYTTEIIADRVIFLDTKQEKKEPDMGMAQSPLGVPMHEEGQINEDDIPF